MSIVKTPQWIAKMYGGKTGRDHLGLGSVSSDRILPSLSPSINVQTNHPRYYSFYAFLLDEYWQRNLSRTQKTWEDFFRPRDFLFSLAANLCENPEHGEMRSIVGSDKTSTLADLAKQNKKHFAYDPDYIQSPFSGYGLYYRTVMAEMGIIFPGGKNLPYPVDVPTPAGKKLAEAFRSGIRNTRYYQEYFDTAHSKISVEVIKEYIQNACLCQLKTSNAPDRDIALDVFLHFGRDDEPEARRETFRMFLDIANQTVKKGVSEDEFRQLLYFRETDNGHHYSPSADVHETYLRWRLYQAREYYAFALNGLWYYLCEWGVDMGGDYQPLHINEFWNHLEKALDFRSLAKWFELPPCRLGPNSSFSDLLTWLSETVKAKPGKFDEMCKISSPINEHNLFVEAMEKSSPPFVMTAGLLTMLGLIVLRFRDAPLQRSPVWEIARMGAEIRLSMDSFIRNLDRFMKVSHPTIVEVMRWIYENNVILQHELVATSKLPENTFRFQRDGDYLQFFNLSNSLGFMNSRYDAISTTIYELGLCGDLHEPKHVLTQDGRTLLQTGDL